MLYAELTDTSIAWGIGMNPHLIYDDWTFRQRVWDLLDVGHRRKHARRVIYINRICVAS